jgi:tRNA modification GTPase
MRTRGEAGPLPRVVLLGLPNVGKSSLLNALAGSEAAIVSQVAGTTRDFVTRVVKIGQRSCLITDTAGISSDAAPSGLAETAQETTRQQAQHADLTLLCLEASRPMVASERETLDRAMDSRLVVLTKCDLPPCANFDQPPSAIRTSSVTGDGIDPLRGAILQALDASLSEAGLVAGTADRCRESLRLASDSLQRARMAISAGEGEEFIASEVRVALDELGRVVGAVYTEDILDRVFSRFCIGK